MKTLLTVSLSLVLAGAVSTRLGAADAPKESKPVVAPAAPATPGVPSTQPKPAAATSVDSARLRAEFDKLREDTKDLPPEERAVKVKEWREKNAALLTGSAGVSGVTSTNTDPAARRKEVIDRLSKQIDDLETKKKAGTLSTVDSDRLKRLTELRTRYQQYGAPGQLPSRKPTGGTEKKAQVETPAVPPVEKK